MSKMLWFLCIWILLASQMGCQEATTQPLSSGVALAHQSPSGQKHTKTHTKPLTKRTKVRVAAKAKQCLLPQISLGWYEKAYLLTDRTYLRRMYKRRGYKLPHKTRSMMLATRVIPGVKQPAFQYHSLDNTGFRYSRGAQRWWPASCVKPWAVSGALMRLRQYGLDGDTKIRFTDRYGTYKGTLRKMFMNLTNKRYDRLVTIAGADNLNGPVWRKRYGLPNMVLLRAYGGLRSLRRSPTIYFNHKGRRGKIPGGYAKRTFKYCRSNCTTLFELQDVMRRINLHEELPKAARFNVRAKDFRNFRKRLLRIPNKMGRAFRRVFGRRTKGYNKSGSTKGWDQIENVFIVPPRGKYRYLIAGSVPWWRKDYMADPSLIILNEFGRQTMMILKRGPKDGVSLQLDAGLPLQTTLSVSDPASHKITLRVTQKGIDALALWLNRRKLHTRQIQPGVFEAQFQLPSVRPLKKSRRSKKRGRWWHRIQWGKRDKKRLRDKALLVLRGMHKGRAVAYRSIGLQLPTRGRTLTCR